MKKFLIRVAILAGVATAAAAAQAAVSLYEEQMAHLEEAKIIQTPIAGVQNYFWFDYRVNVVEAQKELAHDLRHVSDTEDLRDAWDEYRTQLSGERRHYIKKMLKRGYRYGTVTLEN